MPTAPIESPSGYAISSVAAFADQDGNAQLVSAIMPLPVAIGQMAGSSLAATTATSVVAGPFVPVVGRSVMLSLQGTWTGTIKVLRSTDGGTTKVPLTVAGSPWAQFSANCCEPVWDESDAAATLYLDIGLASGSVSYRLAQ